MIAVKTVRPCVISVCAGRLSDRCRQISHRILKFAFYSCTQKVTALLLCSILPHLNLIITALCKIWDRYGREWRFVLALTPRWLYSRLQNTTHGRKKTLNNKLKPFNITKEEEKKHISNDVLADMQNKTAHIAGKKHFGYYKKSVFMK